MKFRDLKACEIDTRVQIIKQNGCSLLLYKNARCDMNILDEVVGVTGWKRSHKLIGNNLFCTVEIWDDEKKAWISKEDVGVESYTEKEKGQASDAFKRSCFNIGIGRELYTSPFIWVNLEPDETYSKKDNNNREKFYLKAGVRFLVHHIKIEDGKITELTIKDNKDNLRYDMNKRITVKEKVVKKDISKARVISQEKVEELENMIEGTASRRQDYLDYYNINSLSELVTPQYNAIKISLGKKQYAKEESPFLEATSK